jgi:hypothetical protein
MAGNAKMSARFFWFYGTSSWIQITSGYRICGVCEPLGNMRTSQHGATEFVFRIEVTSNQKSISYRCYVFLLLKQPHSLRTHECLIQQEDQINTKDNLPPIEEATEREIYGLRIF